MSTPLIHFEVTGRDGKRLQDFFGQVFDWKIDANNPMNYGMVNLGSEVGGGIGPSQDGSEGMALFYVGVDDVEATLQKIESAGGKRLFGPMDVPDGPTIAHFADPEGHVVGLFQGM